MIILSQSNVTINRILHKALFRKLLPIVTNNNNLQLIKNTVSNFVETAIVNTDVWQSLHGAGSADGFSLDAHLGLPKHQKSSDLYELLKAWTSQIEVKLHHASNNRYINIAYVFYAIEADWSKILSHPKAIVQNISKRARLGKASQHIPWLSWLLTSGGVTIDGYHIVASTSNVSRSGKALMKLKSSWILPPAFGPYEFNDNFVTRALEKVATDIKFRKTLINIMNNFTKHDIGMPLLSLEEFL